MYLPPNLLKDSIRTLKDTYQTCSNDNYVFFRHVFFGLIEAATAPEKEALTSQLTLTYSRTLSFI